MSIKQNFAAMGTIELRAYVLKHRGDQPYLPTATSFMLRIRVHSVETGRQRV